VSPDRSAQLKKAKRHVRARVKAERDAMSPTARAELGARAVGSLLDLPEIRMARRVMAFWSFGSEVATEPLVTALHERGVSVCLPRIEESDLVPRVYEPGDPTTMTTFGAREPGPDAERVNPATIDVVVTPAVAFDRGCRRVGYGGGFFDRFLGRSAPRAFRVGLAYSLQILDKELPSGRADVPVHAVVTDREVIRCADGSSRLEP
jgi:5-formyltetrahydrofolate cyclo-ligase